jgi:hypothetical protein
MVFGFRVLWIRKIYFGKMLSTLLIKYKRNINKRPIYAKTSWGKTKNFIKNDILSLDSIKSTVYPGHAKRRMV